MKIGYFTSIEGWGGSEMYLLRLMQGVRVHGYAVLLFCIEGTRLWDEAGEIGIDRVAWRSIQTQDARPRTDGRALLDPVAGATEYIEGSVTPKGLKPSVYSLPSTIKRFMLKLAPDALKLLAGNVREVLHLKLLFRSHPVDVMHVSNSG
jgi:hypothetical protein